jgi:hypothetical protein
MPSVRIIFRDDTSDYVMVDDAWNAVNVDEGLLKLTPARDHLTGQPPTRRYPLVNIKYFEVS